MPQHRDDSIATKATLLDRLKDSQDRASWQVFYDIYSGLIFNLAIKSGLNRVEAEDTVQETLRVVADQIATFKYDPAIGSFKGWLYNIARWRIADQFRKRDPVLSLAMNPETGTGTRLIERVADGSRESLEEIWNAELEKSLLDSAMSKVRRQIDPQKYQLFDFYVNKDWSPEKVATMFGVSTNQVYLAKHRITELIKEEVVRLQKEIT